MVRHGAQPHQGPQQGRHGKDVDGPARHGEDHDLDGVDGLERALADVFQFFAEGEEAEQADQQYQDREDSLGEAGSDVAVKQLHVLSCAANAPSIETRA